MTTITIDNKLLRGDWQLSADEFEEKLRRILGVPAP